MLHGIISKVNLTDFDKAKSGTFVHERENELINIANLNMEINMCIHKKYLKLEKNNKGAVKKIK